MTGTLPRFRGSFGDVKDLKIALQARKHRGNEKVIKYRGFISTYQPLDEELKHLPQIFAAR